MIEQRTEEWIEIRRGKFTASEIHKLMGVKGMGKTGESYVLAKVAEALGADPPEVNTYAMQWGIDNESVAKRIYSKSFKCAVSEQPFIVAPWCEDAGCSPDGLVVEFDNHNLPKNVTRGIEVKCPYNPVHHLENLIIETQEEFKKQRIEYYWQIQMCMAVTGYDEWDFVSYYPFVGDVSGLKVMTIKADQSDIELLKSRINEAVKLKSEIIEKVTVC